MFLEFVIVEGGRHLYIIFSLQLSNTIVFFLHVNIKHKHSIVLFVTKFADLNYRRKSKSKSSIAHSQLFVHVLLIHGIVMYFCSSYASYSANFNSNTQRLPLTQNKTTFLSQLQQ
jgi:hypothetical protein